MTIEKFYDFYDVKGMWEELIKKNSNASIYQSSEYAELIWRHLQPYKLILLFKPIFFVFYDEDKPIMIVPLFKKLFSKRYSIYGSKTGCGYLDFIYSDALNFEKMNECLILLKEKYHIFNISLNHVRGTTLLGEFAKAKGCTNGEMGCTSIKFSDSYEEYYNALSKNTKQNIRTAYNRMNTDGLTYSFNCSNYRDLSQTQKKELLSIYISRQVTKYKKMGGIIYKYFTKYVDIGTYAEKHNALEGVCILRINEEIAAFFDVLYQGETVIVPRLSIVDVFQRYSPGVILLNESIKWMVEKTSIRTIDLTHGTEKYKVSQGGTVTYCIDDTLLLGE